MRAKYVMTDRGPILFPGSFKHDDFKIFSPTSAGFVVISDDLDVQTYGKSISLDMEPNPIDAPLIKRAFS